MIRQCGWCQEYMGEKEPLEDRSVTTGICDPCRDEYLTRKKETAEAVKTTQRLTR